MRLAVTKRCGLDDAQRLELICETIRYCQRVGDMMGPAVVWRKALREAIHFTWETRRGGKNVAARYRSLASKGLTFGSGALVYEHAIPMLVVQDELMKLNDPNPEDVRNILDRMLVTCIITVDEDREMGRRNVGRSMPTGWDGTDALARYTHAGIDLEKNDRWAFAETA